MNHKNMTLAIQQSVGAVAMTGVAFAIPQQALAYGHHHHNNNSNSIKVDQQTNQLNNCTSLATCLNTANNTADIHR